MKKVDRGNYVRIKSDSYYDAPSFIGYGGEMFCDLKWQLSNLQGALNLSHN